MTFEDLPQNWGSLPLTDPRLATDVVDLFLGTGDRNANSLLVLLCGHDLRLVQPICIGDVDWHCTAAERRHGLEFLVGLPISGVIVAASSGRPIPEEVADRWRRTAQETCTAAGVTLLHFLTAVPGVLPDHVWQAPPRGLAS